MAVIPHPVFPGTVHHEDDGRTLVFFGLIQRYKQLEHALELARALDARLIVAGDPLYDISSLRSVRNVERLGYQTDVQLDAALAESTVALFPYRPELDQSGALLRALGSGVPAAAYDAGGIAEPVRRYEAGVVAPLGDLHRTDGERPPLARRRRRARAGPGRSLARPGRADLGRGRDCPCGALRRPLCMRLRRRAFGDLVATQLELFAADHAQLLAACEAALRAYDDAAGEDAEERYGEYVDLVDEATGRARAGAGRIRGESRRDDVRRVPRSVQRRHAPSVPPPPVGA